MSSTSDDNGIFYNKDGVRVSIGSARTPRTVRRAIASIGTASPSCGPATADRATSTQIREGRGRFRHRGTDRFGEYQPIRCAGCRPSRPLHRRHTPHLPYAAGYLVNQINPRLFMPTHMRSTILPQRGDGAEVRTHYHGPFHFGAPDGVVVNVTKDEIWVREASSQVPANLHESDPYSRPLRCYGQLIVPHRPLDARDPRAIHARA